MKRVKTTIGMVGLLTLMVLLVLPGYYLIKLAKLGFFKDYSAIEINQLTTQQKEDELKYLLQFVNTHYPYLDIIKTEKGLNHPASIEKQIIRRGLSSRNNKEYLKVILEYLMVLKQGTGHADIHRVHERPKDNFDFGHWYLGLKNGISAKSLYYQYYWTKLISDLDNEKWISSPLKIIYDKGEYVINQEYVSNTMGIPKGSILKTIDHIEIDSFLYSRPNQYLLRFDARLKKPYCFEPNPLIIDNDTSKHFWTVRLELPSKELVTVEIPKSRGFRSTREIPDIAGNTICQELTKKTGYIKIKQFLNHPQCLADFDTIHSFLSNSAHRYEKLIIDLRGNTGGAPKYWQKLFVERFIKTKKRVVQYAAIKKETWDLIKHDFYLSRPLTWYDINHGTREKLLLREIPLPLSGHHFLNDSKWKFIKNTKIYKPKNTYEFEIELIFMVDNDCFSATEDFAVTIKQIDLGKLAGANTYGGTMVICEPWFIELPHSHLIVLLELQIAFNSDGNSNAVYGTKPDVILDSGKFPTPYPKSYEKNDLLEDLWILHVLDTIIDR